MSTRASVYYEEDGIHIYKELAANYEGLYLEYESGGFSVVIQLPLPISDMILAGVMATQKEATEAV